MGPNPSECRIKPSTIDLGAKRASHRDAGSDQHGDRNGHSITTLNLSGGVCTTGDVVSVQVHLENITDEARTSGLVSDNPVPETYSVP